MLAALLLAGEGPNTELAGLLWLVFGFLALIAVVGWLTSREEGVGLATSRNQTPSPAKDTAALKAMKSPARKKSR